MVFYKPILTTLIVEQLAKVFIEIIVKYHVLPDLILTNQGFLFTLKFWSFFCYYLNVKRQLSTAFYLETDRQTKRQNNTMKAYLRAYYQF